MSELYLVLKTRLDDVTKWVPLGTTVMREAREAQGISYETVSRAVHVSAKTYERWEKRGEVPNTALEAVADVLRLQVERSDSRSIVEVADAKSAEDRLDRLEEQVAEVLAGVRAILAQRGDEEEPSADESG